MNRTRIQECINEIASRCLQEQKYVCPVDVLLSIGWLNPVHFDRWKKGEIPYLESVIQGNLGKISFAMKEFRKWALANGLKPSETAYYARTRGPRQSLQFSKSGDPGIESFYRTHYVSPELTEKRQEKLKQKLSEAP
jgi:hypothetical protein